MTDLNPSLLAIQPLGLDDTPEAALFCVFDDLQNGSTRIWKRGEPGDGIAFIVGTEGILATAAHVVWLNQKFPGGTVRVLCPSPSIPLRATARVLSLGWRGPQSDQSGKMPKLPGRNDVLDERPDVVKEDIALLQLIPESIEIDSSRGGDTEPLPRLLSRLRVMPIGVPGYRSMEGTVFTMWFVDRHFRAPRMVAVNGTFRTHERALHSAFQIEAPEVREGFSGTPVWDANRRLAVGFVRSGSSKRLKGVARCTDARALHEFAGLPLAWDTDLRQVAKAAKELASGFLGNRYEPSSTTVPVFVEPRARTLRAQLDMGLTDDGKDGAPAINYVRGVLNEPQMVCLFGGPGSGKSTLLQKFALRMLDENTLIAKVPCIPLIFDAREISENFDLDALFRMTRQYNTNGVLQEGVLSTALLRNDVRVVLLIDGLDEIKSRQAARLLAHCQGLLSGGTSVFRVLLTSRPDPQLLKQANIPIRPYTLIELLPFDSAQIEEYVGKHMPDADEGTRFLSSLRRVDWHRNASPLQLKMASMVFRVDDSLPSREADLPFEYVRLLINNSHDERHAHEGLDNEPRTWDEIYRPNVAKVLQAIALVNLQQGQQTVEQLAESLDSLKGTEPFAVVLQRPEECIDYVCRDLIPKIGLIAVERRADGDRLRWDHATFIDILAAEARLSIAGNDPSAVAALVYRKESFYGERFMLVQLSAMDRADWCDQVNQRVERAMEAPFTDQKEGIFALRALASGARLAPMIKQRVVNLLLRMALSPKTNFMMCSELFTEGSGLPSPRDIFQREDMRQDVIAAMWQRFRLRDPRRRGQVAPLVVTRAEASLLDLLHLWNEWLPEGLELAHPDSSSRIARRSPLSQSTVRPYTPGTFDTAVVDRGGFEVMHKDNTMSRFEMPARMFLEGVVAMAQNLQSNLSPSQVVSLYLKGIAHVFDDESGHGGTGHR